ncbi:alpha/beta fold hydrolase [Streptomyces sp. NPDC016309]|uniref:alpha/beta fold hydrolase n=1 Tax=Streptomyces sp. NPDC016309 TaxID=3364965 RepID=UPI00370307C3
MSSFTADDGTTLAYRVSGAGTPLICLPGGPMQASAYLGDLGGLTAHRRLVMPDLRGTGRSDVPADPGSYRCDRLVDDVEALRRHLGLERMDLLAHSAGANLAALYLTRHPGRVGRLALVTPSVLAVDVPITGDARLATAARRRDEPWFPAAYAALEAIVAGRGTADSWRAMAPFTYGRWDAAARAHHAAGDEQRNDEAARVHASEGAFAPDTVRAAFARRTSPVLVLAGEFDVAAPPGAMAAYAALFPDADLRVQPGAGHFPWLDDPAQFTATAAAFLS